MTNVREAARIDLDRAARTGVPEVVLAEGKRDEHLRDAVRQFMAGADRCLVTRLDPERLPLLSNESCTVTYHEDARLAVVEHDGTPPVPRTGGRVAIVAAGTADIPVAEEARLTAEHLGCDTTTHYDVGVAGIHRLFPELEAIQGADAVIVAAGREGALAPVVAGLIDVPIIGLPTSIGYGHGGQGQAALLTMLQACAPLTLVNIDAGFVAGACAANMANRVAKARATREGASAPPHDAAERRRAPHGKT